MNGGLRIPDLTEADLRDLLASRPAPTDLGDSEANCSERINSTHVRRAAVLMPLVREQNRWHFLFIRRTETVADHKGQVSFPGGAYEPNDNNLETTALRETEEEIGVACDDVQILGRLPGLITVSAYCVAPFVGMINWPYPLQLSRDEVTRAFTIPLDWLADVENREIRKISRGGEEIDVIYYKLYEGELLWGATARMVDNFIEMLGE